ncbi:glycosyltransferase family 2 protein [Paraburkholderia sp. RP-4-7]|uniref:Glycosyltransferase family 2 protein n=1 Tax=Paraburkholderia polaris TaxID=2728848 RepID=A0A848I936_9BURK|nr:glycosyltransferase family 2 protein [Paraburkholderia polaris]NML98987.1 glycosyltransferase family 2 protein [Paraburkholderia polaris]
MSIFNRCASIYVSYHSEKYIDCFLGRHRQELGETVLIVNSTPEKYAGDLSDVKCLEARKNVGFAAANNLGIVGLSGGAHDFIIFINPDVVMPQGWLGSFSKICDLPEYRDVGVFTGPLLGYSFARDEPTGLIDSLGIWRTSYGKWFDKQQGQPTTAPDSVITEPQEVPAVCGALMVVRKKVIEELVSEYGFFFDESYFMYKEDIEVSLRIRRKGWRTLLHPSLAAYHCRGWDPNRGAMPKWTRSISSRNELKMHLRHQWRGVPYSLLKYLYVKLMEK